MPSAAAPATALQEQVAQTNPPPREGAAGDVGGRVERAHACRRTLLLAPTSGSSGSASCRTSRSSVGSGAKSDRRPELLTLRDRPANQLLERRSLTARLRHDHVRVGADRIGVPVRTVFGGLTIESEPSFAGWVSSCSRGLDRSPESAGRSSPPVLDLEVRQMVVRARNRRRRSRSRRSSPTTFGDTRSCAARRRPSASSRRCPCRPASSRSS